MAYLNKIMIIGNVGADPEMRYTPNGNPVTRFRVATNRTYTTSSGERREETEWFTVISWNQLAEQCNQFLAKGRRVFVEGRFQSRTWDGQDGQRHFSSEVVANRVIFLDRQPGAPLAEDEAPAGASATGGSGSEDLPF